MEKSGAMYPGKSSGSVDLLQFLQSVCYAVSDGKDSLSEKEVEKFREMTTIKLNKLRKRKKPEESEKEHEKN